MKDLEHLTVVQEGPVATVTLNRPQRRNALSLSLMRELIRLLALLQTRRCGHRR